MTENGMRHIDAELDRSELSLGLYASENYLTKIPDFHRRSVLNINTESAVNYGNDVQEHLALEGGERVRNLEHTAGARDTGYVKPPEGFKDFGILAGDSSEKGTLEETCMQDFSAEVPLDRSRRNCQQREERTTNFTPEESEARPRPRSIPDEPMVPKRSIHR